MTDLPAPPRPADEVPPETLQSGENVCRRCAGRGHLDDGSLCPDCAGSGRVTETVGDA